MGLSDWSAGGHCGSFLQSVPQACFPQSGLCTHLASGHHRLGLRVWGLCVCFAVFVHTATLLSQAYQAFKIRTLPPRRGASPPCPPPCPSHAEGSRSKPLLVPASHPANLSRCVPASPGELQSGWDSDRQTFLTPPVPDLGGRHPPPPATGITIMFVPSEATFWSPLLEHRTWVCNQSSG